jgi:hypothetical protein
MRRLLPAALVAAALPVQAAPPANADPALKPWFESLKAPQTGIPCCSIADCRTTEYREADGGFEALIDRQWPVSAPRWEKVPPERVLTRTDNPTGRAVVCYTLPAGILCFVRPAEG